MGFQGLLSANVLRVSGFECNDACRELEEDNNKLKAVDVDEIRVVVSEFASMSDMLSPMYVEPETQLLR